MQSFICMNCGFDVGDNPLGICPSCSTDLSVIDCLACSYSGPRRFFIRNDEKCPECSARVHIPEGPGISLVKTESARPTVLSISNGVIKIWPVLMYLIASSFLIAANTVLFMMFSLQIELTPLYLLFMVASTIAVIGLNIAIFGGLIAAIAKEMFYFSNQKRVIAVIYFTFLVTTCITGYLFMLLDVNVKDILPALSILLISLAGSMAFTTKLINHAIQESEALQAQSGVDKKVMDLYAGTYDETRGVNSLEFKVVYGDLCVGVPEDGHLTKTNAIDINKFEHAEDKELIFTFVEDEDYDLVAGMGELTRYYQRVSP